MRALLHLLEETVPIGAITKDWSEDPTKQAAPFDDAVTPELRHALKETYRVLTESGETPAAAKLRLMNMEPFHQFPEAVAALDE